MWHDGVEVNAHRVCWGNLKDKNILEDVGMVRVKVNITLGKATKARRVEV